VLENKKSWELTFCKVLSPGLLVTCPSIDVKGFDISSVLFLEDNLSIVKKSSN
jgi:hypothetical protein